MIDYQEIFSRRLRKTMQQQGVTIKRLSEQTGIARKTLYAYRMGIRGPGMLALIAIANALGKDLDWLCGMSVKEGE